MHNDTPLGVLMHLRELDRQAGSTSRSLGPRARNTGRATAINSAAGALLRRIREAARLRPIVEGQIGAPRSTMRLWP
jgi:hypothetical protein